ncbi:glycosyltransferase family 1 protein [Flavobacterium sp. Arc3]|uniref:glycosyltransferase family 4 protein n=1 Tax=unclassified Flavobacterium TaxID=196869 RepID=UPI00352D49C7
MDGISRFSLEICKQLKKLGLDFKIIIPKWVVYENKEGFEIVQFGHLKSHFWEQIDLLRFLKSKGNPLLLNLSGLGPLFYKNQIITIHDLSFYDNKKWFSKAYTLFYSIATPISAKNALKILTVSDFSKTEITKYLKIDEGKIEVVYNAVANDLEKFSYNIQISPIVSCVVDRKYILAVSSIDPRKNLQRLIDSFLELNLKDYKLVLVGKTSSHFNIKLRSNPESVIFTGFVSDSDLSVLYKKCDFFIYPSLYEGFGIPPLEAMRNDCAVVVSDIPSLREVCSDAALYVDPFDNESIKNGILKIITDSKLKEELKLKGSSRSRFFKWEVSGVKVYDVINNIRV